MAGKPQLKSRRSVSSVHKKNFFSGSEAVVLVTNFLHRTSAVVAATTYSMLISKANACIIVRTLPNLLFLAGCRSMCTVNFQTSAHFQIKAHFLINAHP